MCLPGCGVASGTTTKVHTCSEGSTGQRQATLRLVSGHIATQSTSVRGVFGRFALAGFIALTAVAAISAWLSQREGRQQAISDARDITRLIAVGVVEPSVTNELVNLDPEGALQMDEVMRRSVIQGSLVRVKIWRDDGTILYSDRRSLIGQKFTLDEDEMAVIYGAPTDVGVSDLTKPENAYEREQGKLLEAYTGIAGPNGERLLFEGYFRYAAVDEEGRKQWVRYAPVTLGALLLLELIQIPIVWSVVRRLRAGQAERELLLKNAVDASDTERRRIASDLHDGVVQDLTGVSLSLAGMARREGNTSESSILDSAAGQVRESVRSLRSLLVEIYPANLEQAGLESALGDLLARCSNRGLDTELNCDQHVDRIDGAAMGLIYRGAQEALRNVLKHARARQVTVNVQVVDGFAALVIDDDGTGVDLNDFAAKPSAGHVGLRVLGDLVAGAGGELILARSTSGGTSFRLKVPLQGRTA